MSERRFVLADFTYMDRAGVLRLYEAGHTYAPSPAIAHAATKRELLAKLYHVRLAVPVWVIAASPTLEFVPREVHNANLNVEATMPLTGPIPEGRSFFCPHCGALYGLTYSRQPNSDNSNVAKCVVCEQTMATWDTTNVPTYKLVHRPEDA